MKKKYRVNIVSPNMAVHYFTPNDGRFEVESTMLWWAQENILFICLNSFPAEFYCLCHFLIFLFYFLLHIKLYITVN